MANTDEKPDVEVEPSNPSDGDNGETVPKAQYTGLQRTLEKQRRINRQSMNQLVDQAEIKATVDRMEGLVASMLEAAGIEDDEALTKFKDQKRSDTRVAQTTRDLVELFNTNDTDWTDTRLDGARATWESGDVVGALAAARTALKSDDSPGGSDRNEDFEARVQAGIQERIKAGGAARVPTNESTAGHSDGSAKPITRDELGDFGDKAKGYKKTSDLRDDMNAMFDRVYRNQS